MAAAFVGYADLPRIIARSNPAIIAPAANNAQRGRVRRADDSLVQPGDADSADSKL